MRAPLVVTSILILYGSVYPLDFSIYTYSPERMAQLLDFNLKDGSSGNIIANVLLFIPFGFFSVFVDRQGGKSSELQIAMLSLAGFVLAYVAQLAQVFIASRVPSGVDVAWNLTGILTGVLTGLGLSRTHVRIPAYEGSLPLPLLLVAGWLAYQWIPFVPTLDLDLLRDNATSLLARRVPSPFWAFQNTILWLLCYQLIERYAPHIQIGWYPLATLFLLAMGGLLIGSTVNVDDFVGAACALILWRVLRGRWYPARLALLLAVAIVGASYLPLALRDTPASFSWIPFSGSLSGSVVINVIATWKKLVLYGLFVWLLLEARVTVIVATAGATVLLFTSEWFQVYFQGGTPEITDALLVLSIGGVIAARRERPRLADRTHAGSAGYAGGIAQQAGWLPAAGVASVLAVTVGIVSTSNETPTAAIRSEVPWAGKRAELVAGLHAYTQRSGSSPNPPDLVGSAVDSGCDVLAITGGSGVAASVSKQQSEAFASLRREFPQLILFLSVASDTGRDHMNVLLHPDQEAEWLPRLHRATNNTSGRRPGNSLGLGHGFLRLVKRIRDGGHPAFLIYNHASDGPERRAESLAHLAHSRLLGTPVDGMAPAPSNQRHAYIGQSQLTIAPRTRQDPAITEAGGVWDLYLASGHDLWGALALPDLEGGRGEIPSCAFSRVHVAAPERSHTGLLNALDAGTFWADTGRLLDHLSLEVEFNGIPRALSPGESADVFTDDGVALARVTLERGPGGMGQALDVEFISSCIDGRGRVLSERLSSRQTSAERMIPLKATSNQDSSCIIRAGIRLKRHGTEPDLLAYTNYIRVNLRLGVLDGGILDWRLHR